MKLLAICAAALTLPLLVQAGAVEGKAIFAKSCRTCHGPEGQGNQAVAKALKVEIPPLGSEQVQAMPDEEIKQVIREGKGKMKPVAGIGGKSLDDVVAHLRTLKK